VKAFEFQEYEPHVFRMIRHLVGVSDDEYASAAFDEVKEKCNLGRSGAYLYYSKNNRFILKTMDEGECWVLLDMLHDYYEYLEQQPHSLLTRFFGCYSLHMFGSTTYFVVMENVFHAARTCG
jgi:1-phosphatidylinositol-4-phosphate 5-kinase